MSDLEMRHTPTGISHVMCHDAESFRLDLSHDVSTQRITLPIQKGREDQSGAMQISPNQQHGSTDAMQWHDLTFIPQIL